jgi:TonB family protein
MNCRLLFFTVVLSTLCQLAFTQEITRYFTYDGKPSLPDSAQRIRKGVSEGGKWHVNEYYKFSQKPFSESWYVDSNFLVADGAYSEYSELPNRKLHTNGQYSNGKKTGLWLSVFDSGKPQDSTLYIDGHAVNSRSYYESGRLRDSFRLDAAGNGSSKGFREDGRLEHSGPLTAWQKSGDWSYYTGEGVLCAVETMKEDTIATALFYDATGKNPALQTKDFEIESDYPGGQSGWLHYINKSLSARKLPQAFLEGRLPGGTVVIIFMVDETGRVTDAKVQESVAPALDKLALDVVKSSSGKWTPAMQHNRRVKSYKKQPITFRME